RWISGSSARFCRPENYRENALGEATLKQVARSGLILSRRETGTVVTAVESPEVRSAPQLGRCDGRLNDYFWPEADAVAEVACTRWADFKRPQVGSQSQIAPPRLLDVAWLAGRG